MRDEVPLASDRVPEELLSKLDDRVGEVLSRWIPRGSPVALLDVPTHTNVGDHAITLGELAYLERAGNPLRYVCTLHDYCAARLRERLGDAVILLHGGGNLGDLWPLHQQFRERVLVDFPRSPVVQLPQSIKFASRASLECARRSFGSHPNFALLVRDCDAYSFADEQFNCRVELCPDSAFALGPLSRDRSAPDVDVLVLARTDHETTTPLRFDNTAEVEMTDWLDGPSLSFRALRFGGAQIGAKARRARPAFTVTAPLVSRAYRRLAVNRLEFGLSLLSRGRAVVTDRLHGHILCTMLGIPHVIRDTGYGKLSSFHRAWTAESPLAIVRETQVEALDAALTLARQSTHDRRPRHAPD